MRVALAQVDCVLGDVQENARRARTAIGEARGQGADLVVFPELSLTGYALGTVSDDYRRLQGLPHVHSRF